MFHQPCISQSKPSPPHDSRLRNMMATASETGDLLQKVSPIVSLLPLISAGAALEVEAAQRPVRLLQQEMPHSALGGSIPTPRDRRICQRIQLPSSGVVGDRPSLPVDLLTAVPTPHTPPYSANGYTESQHS